jgi:acetyl esterase/lipase
MRRLLCVAILCAGGLWAQEEPKVIPLWSGDAPGAQGHEDADVPTITVYQPRPPGVPTAVIICPGGGYRNLAANHEGRQIANWFNSYGITAFVLKYRLGPKYHHPVELQDAQRAIRMVRSRAQEYSISPDRIGILGFSAGGHLASSAGTHFDDGNAGASDTADRVSSRPDFLVLGYPVISFTTPYVHKGSRTNLLGDNPDPRLVESLSSELQVTARTPPTFLIHTDADTTVPPENSVLFYMALRKAGVPAEMHIFEKGPHGLGLASRDQSGAWPGLLATWLRVRGLL